MNTWCILLPTYHRNGDTQSCGCDSSSRGETKIKSLLQENNIPYKTEVSFDESLSFDMDGNELHLEDILGTDPDIVTRGLEENLNKRIVIDEINKLSPRDREIIVLRYGLLNGQEMTQKDVAELLGISQSYISRIEKKVIRRIKNVVNN